MVQYHSLLPFLLLPILTLCAPQGHRGGGGGGRGGHTKVTYTTVLSTATVYGNTAETQNANPTAADVPPQTSSAQAQSTPITPSTGSGVGGQVTFQNNCNYGVRVQKVPPPACGGATEHPVDANSPWTDTLEECDAGNIALKVYRLDKDDSQPMHFEYGLNVTQRETWYNLSFNNCIVGQDLSACAGGPWMIDSAKSGTSCGAYQCSDYNSCCKLQGYCDPYATMAPQQPVGGCKSDDMTQLTVSMSIC